MRFGSVSMSSTLTAWVKNVYSLCVEGVVTRAYSYTPHVNTTTQATTPRVKPQVFTSFLNSFIPTLYTAFFPPLPLLDTHLYTISTVPTIKKMNKK